MRKPKNSSKYPFCKNATGNLGNAKYDADMFNYHAGTGDLGGTSDGISGGVSDGFGGGLFEDKRSTQGRKAEHHPNKRYVRRYFVRPINVFCSNKAEILNMLVDYQDKDLTIYTLNNLSDYDKDVTKLTKKDVIYYYLNGQLYDKNWLKILDYKLSIAHEEKRKRIDVKTASEATLDDVYWDRNFGNEAKDRPISEALVGEDELFVDFDDVNPYGEVISKKNGTCACCGEPINGNCVNTEDGDCYCTACAMKFLSPDRRGGV